MIVIVNPPIPDWAKRGLPRPPLWMKEYFPNQWEEELIKYGEPGEVGKYFAEEILKDVRKKWRLSDVHP